MVVQVAALLALATATALHPGMATLLSVKATVPPMELGLTVAVNVTGLPTGAGLADEASRVVDEAAVTVCVIGEAAEPPASESPLKVAPMLCVPVLGNESLHVASPVVTGTAAHVGITVPLSVKLTVPPVVEGETFAEKVTIALVAIDEDELLRTVVELPELTTSVSAVDTDAAKPVAPL